MAMDFNGFVLLSLVFASFVASEVSILDDPASLPGHMQPLGTGRPITQVTEIEGFPEPNGETNMLHCKNNILKFLLNTLNLISLNHSIP